MSPRIARWIAVSLPWLLLAISVSIVAFQVRNPYALVSIGEQWARIGALAAVMTVIILTGGIDLSVASIVLLSSVAMGVCWRATGSTEVGAAVAILTGVAAGAGNAALVRCGLPPLVATLVTMTFYAGLGRALCHGKRIVDTSAPELTKVCGVPAEYVLLLVVFSLAYFVVHHTLIGRWCFAIGENQVAARFAAVPVNATQCGIYIASGLVCSFVAILYTLNTGVIPDAHVGIELEVIACVVVGGTLITGGRGGIGRTLLGWAVVSNLSIGLQFMSTHVQWINAQSRLMLMGALVILVAIGNEWLSRTEQQGINEPSHGQGNTDE